MRSLFPDPQREQLEEHPTGKRDSSAWPLQVPQARLSVPTSGLSWGAPGCWFVQGCDGFSCWWLWPQHQCVLLEQSRGRKVWQGTVSNHQRGAGAGARSQGVVYGCGSFLWLVCSSPGSACACCCGSAECPKAVPEHVSGICGPSYLPPEIIDRVPGALGRGRASLLTV